MANIDTNKVVNNVLNTAIKTRFGLLLVFNIIALIAIIKLDNYNCNTKIVFGSLYIISSVICYIGFLVQEYFYYKIKTNLKDGEKSNEQ